MSSADQVTQNTLYSGYLFKNAWYSHAIRNVYIDRIEVQYTDMTTETCNGNYEPSEEERATRQRIAEIAGNDALKGLLKGCAFAVLGFIALIVLILLLR